MMRFGIPLVGMLLAAVLLFTGLGHYPLWDDEAGTALGAKGIMRTGDTSVMIDHNIFAYRNGIMLHGLFDRQSPPLATYLAAPFIGRDGTSAFRARLPFAACGLAAIGLMLWWTRRSSPLTQLLVALGTLGNVTLLLYLRQCRYYAPAILLSVALIGLYLHGRSRRIVPIAAISVLLFATNYLICTVLYLGLAADYLLWGRKERPLTRREWLTLVVTLAVCCSPLALIWNPFRVGVTPGVFHHPLADRVWMGAATWRDMNRSEFGAGGLLVASLVIGLLQRDRWLLRGWLALALFVLFTMALAPQQTELRPVFADIRYLSFAIPLCIALGVRGILLLARARAWVALPLGLLAFGTNLLNGGPLLPSGFRLPLVDYVRELRHPPPDPYTAALRWIDGSVHPGESILVVPGYMEYPLMFHAPWPVYAWQLAYDNHEPGLANLPPIHFVGRIPPDYVLVFGPDVIRMEALFADWSKRGVSYQRVALLDTFWKDLYRPELFWRSSVPITNYNRSVQAIYAFRRVAQ